MGVFPDAAIAILEAIDVQMNIWQPILSGKLGSERRDGI